LTGFYKKKSGSAAGIIEKFRKGNTYAQLSDANSTALPHSYISISSEYTSVLELLGSGGGIPPEMWIIWDGTMLHYGLAGRSQNVLFNLYLLIDPNIEYKQVNIFYSDPLPDLRPDLEAWTPVPPVWL
jgi:hypothetical protein